MYSADICKAYHLLSPTHEIWAVKQYGSTGTIAPLLTAYMWSSSTLRVQALIIAQLMSRKYHRDVKFIGVNGASSTGEMLPDKNIFFLIKVQPPAYKLHHHVHRFWPAAS